MAHEIDAKRVRNTKDLGAVVRERRQTASLTQAHASGLAGVGTRFLAELENGKPTAQIGKALQILDLLGLDVWLVPRERGDLG